MRERIGLTLIEIVVVLIIVGILMAIGAPAYFDWIKRSKASEALTTLHSLKAQLVPCLRAHQGDEPSCFPPGSICNIAGFTNYCAVVPNLASPNFLYIVSNAYMGPDPITGLLQFVDINPQSWTVTAYYNGVGGNNYLAIRGSADDTQASCVAMGYYRGIC